MVARRSRRPGAFPGALLLTCLAAGALAEDAAPGPEPAALAEARDRLRQEFDGLLAEPEGYAARVAAECGVFPEGDLFPFVFPALAYVNLALREPAGRAAHLARAERLIALADRAVAAHLRLPGGDLRARKIWGEETTYLGSLNLALAAYRLAGGERFEPLHAHLSALLFAALRRSDGRPLPSCPGLTWPYDTVPALLSLHLRDLRTGRDEAGQAVRAHLAWLERDGLEPASGLPRSQLPDGAPRGCDLSLRIALLAQLDPDLARRFYARYGEHHWLDWGALAGFAEYPGGAAGAADVDSGPIALGIGLAATGLGFAAALAADDRPRLARLAGELGQWHVLRDSLAGQRLPLEPAGRGGAALAIETRYLTGFLFGDAMLFWAVSWTPWRRPGS